MGNLCGKQAKESNFQGTGRTLGSAPAPQTKASVPARVATDAKAGSKSTAAAPGRAVGGSGGSNDPRAAAAAAAEVRSLRSKSKAAPPMTTTVWL